jgi:hypothetical protein
MVSIIVKLPNQAIASTPCADDSMLFTSTALSSLWQLSQLPAETLLVLQGIKVWTGRLLLCYSVFCEKATNIDCCVWPASKISESPLKSTQKHKNTTQSTQKHAKRVVRFCGCMPERFVSCPLHTVLCERCTLSAAHFTDRSKLCNFTFLAVRIKKLERSTHWVPSWASWACAGPCREQRSVKQHNDHTGCVQISDVWCVLKHSRK